MTAGMPTRGVAQDMSQHGGGPTPGVQYQAQRRSAPQYQGTQMQLGAMLQGQLGIAQASKHQGFARTVGFVTPRQVQKCTGPSTTRYGRAAGSGYTSSSGRGTDTPTVGDVRDTWRPSDRHHGHDDSRQWWAGNYRIGRATGKWRHWGTQTQDTSGGRAFTCGIFWDRNVLRKVGPLHFGSRNSTQLATMAEGCQWGCSMHQCLQG